MAAGAVAGPGSNGITVLQLDVLLDEQHDQLQLQPPAEEFVEGLAAWLRGITSIARGVPQLQQHQQLQVCMWSACTAVHMLGTDAFALQLVLALAGSWSLNGSQFASKWPCH